MELRHLTYFVAVAEELHFGRAARKVGIAQPPLSQQIRRLEDELGLRLFDRTRRKVTLTDGGRMFLDEARATLARASRAMELARRVARGEVGPLAMGFVSSALLDETFVRIARAFRAKHPDIELRLEQMSTAQQVQALREHSLHAGLLRPPVLDPEGGLALLPVRSEPLIAVLPDGHPLAKSKAFQISQLEGDAFVMFPRDRAPGLYDDILAWCVRSGFTPRVRYRVAPMHAVSGLVAAGFGVSIMPASIQRYRLRGLVYRTVSSAPKVSISIAYRRADDSPLLQAFLSVARTRAE